MHAVEAPPSPLEASRNRRVLVVDDDPAIHEALRKIFGAEQAFELTSAYDGQDAARRCHEARAHGEPFALAFVDVHMRPGSDGMKTVRELWRLDPTLQIAICTAYSDHAWQDMRARFGEPSGLLVLKKPFDDVEVLEVASALTLRWEKALSIRLRMRALATSAALQPAELWAHGHEVSTNVAENYLHVGMKGRMEAHAAGEFLADVIGQAQRLLPGFSVLVDLREARPTSELIADYIGAAQTALVELGATRVVRIVGEGAASALLQVLRKQREARATFDVIIVSTEEEALRALRGSRDSLVPLRTDAD